MNEHYKKFLERGAKERHHLPYQSVGDHGFIAIKQPEEDELMAAMRRLIARTPTPLAPVHLLLAAELMTTAEWVCHFIEKAENLQPLVAHMQALQEISICSRLSNGDLRDSSAEMLLQLVLKKGLKSSAATDSFSAVEDELRKLNGEINDD